MLDAAGLFAWCLTLAKNRQGLTSATGAHINLVWQPAFQKFIEQEETSGKNNQNDQYEECQRSARRRYRS
jgi:hypothetical protein